VPAELDLWWLATQLFIRWAKQGVSGRLLELVRQRGVALGMTFIDGTNIRAHHKGVDAETGALGAGRWALGAGRWALGAGRWALGGAVRTEVRAYNTSGGRCAISGQQESLGPYDGQIAVMRDGGRLAESLLSEATPP
jgi:hypothetical protein